MEDRLLMKIAEAGPLEVSSLLQVCGDYLSQSKPQARLHWIINDDLEQVSAGLLLPSTLTLLHHGLLDLAS